MDKTVLQNTEKVYQAHLHHPAWFIQVVNLLKWHMQNFLRQHILTFPGAWIIDSGSEMVLSYENAVQFQWTIVQWCFWHNHAHTAWNRPQMAHATCISVTVEGHSRETVELLTKRPQYIWSM